MKDYTTLMSNLNAYRQPGRSTDGIAIIREFESRMHITLPSDYRDFVSVWGISAFKGKVAFPIRGNPPFGREAFLDVCFGFRAGHGYHLPDEVQDYKGRIPPELIPVAQDPGSNLICLGIAGATYEHVFYWDKESEGHPDAIWPVADSWDDFMNLPVPWGVTI